MKHKSHSVYIVLTHTGTVLSRCIKTYTKAEYTHASLSLDRGLTEMYSFGRKTLYNPVFAGFVREDVQNGLYSIRPNTTCSVFELEVSKKEYRTIQRQIMEMKRREKELSYSLIGLFGIMFNTPIERENSYFCSQFVAATLEKAGVGLLDKPPTMTTPKDFMSSERLSLIFEGKLNEYPYFEESPYIHPIQNGRVRDLMRVVSFKNT